MRLIAIALAALLLTGCGFIERFRNPAPEINPVVVVPTERTTAEQCLRSVRRSDVPARPYVESAVSRYIRTLEDGLELCQSVVREGLENGERLNADN